MQGNPNQYPNQQPPPYTYQPPPQPPNGQQPNTVGKYLPLPQPKPVYRPPKKHSYSKVFVITGAIIGLLLLVAAVRVLENQQKHTDFSQDTPAQHAIAILSDDGADISQSVVNDSARTTVSTVKQVGAQANNTSARSAIMLDCFTIQRDLWTAQPSIGLTDVDVFLYGNVVDQYGATKNEEVGSCDLIAQTEQRFNWGNLSSQQAWLDYDYTALLPSLQQ